jgi:uncharacterized membrane protein
MTAGDGQAQKKIEAYLTTLRSLLRGMSSETSREIIEELRSHIADKASAGGVLIPHKVDAALDALGSPANLASLYTTDELLMQAEVSRSPVKIIDSLSRWASFSIIGFLVLISSVFGYFVGFALVLCAVLKPFHSPAAGLWRLADGELSLRMGFGIAPPAGRELLGWWIIPLGLVVGCGLVTLTTRFALWCVKEYRASRSPRLRSCSTSGEIA